MTSDQALTNTVPNQLPLERPPCPLWKKVLAGVLAVTAVALLIPGTVWLDNLNASWKGMIAGFAVWFGYSVLLVLTGIAVVSLLLWVLSRSQGIMSRGKSAVEYMVHCYPQKIKARILHRS